jgi:hypothetical protein
MDCPHRSIDTYSFSIIINIFVFYFPPRSLLPLLIENAMGERIFSKVSGMLLLINFHPLQQYSRPSSPQSSLMDIT